MRDFFEGGSPPPMRGKVKKTYISILASRITPAHAGKRQKDRHPHCGAEDHPRPCGEKCRR